YIRMRRHHVIDRAVVRVALRHDDVDVDVDAVKAENSGETPASQILDVRAAEEYHDPPNRSAPRTGAVVKLRVTRLQQSVLRTEQHTAARRRPVLIPRVHERRKILIEQHVAVE